METVKLEGFEFQHIHSKSGKDILFGKLADYTASEVADGNYQETNQHYVIECPYCRTAYLRDKSYEGPYNKRKLYVLKDYSTGFCFRCDQAFVDSDESVKLKVSTPEPPVSMRDFQLETLPQSGGTWNLDLFDSFSVSDERGLDYLIKCRHPYFKKLAGALNIRFMGHNPVIPFYYHGKLIYYQVKLAFGDHKIKYFSPNISHKPAYVIEHGSNRNFVVCEGTFDAISLLIQAPGYTPFAVLGSTITDYQLTMLRTYIPDRILVYLDETELSVKVANRIRSVINYADVDIIKSNGQDPEEMLKYRLSEEMEVSWIK